VSTSLGLYLHPAEFGSPNCERWENEGEFSKVVVAVAVVVVVREGM
jgi:hypothetical protein